MSLVSEIASALVETTVPDSARIAAATKRLKEQYYTQPACLPALIEIAQKHESSQIRQLAAVEARKQVPIFWEECPQKAAIRPALLQSTLAEADKLVRHSSSRIIASIAKIDLPENAWSDLPAFLVGAATSADVRGREVGVYVLYTLLDTLEELFADRIADLFNLFATTINDAESLTVRATTLLAIGRLSEIISPDDKHSLQQFRAVLPAMVNVLQQTVEQGDAEHVRQGFDVFQTLLMLEPQLLSKSLEDLLKFMVTLGSAEEADDEFRVLALSWVLSCARYRRKKLKTMRCARQLVQAMLRIGREDSGDPADEEDNPARLAYRVVDALSTSLPTSHVYEPLLGYATQMAQGDAPDRKSALICLGVATEGAVDFVSSHLEQILFLVTRGLSDADGSVQRAALLALGQIAVELPEDIAAKHEVLLPPVFQLVQSQGAEVAKSAMNALDAMLESLDQKDMLRYLDQLVPSFIHILRSAGVEHDVKATVLAALGSAAHSAKEAFVPYLAGSMDAVLPIMRSTETATEEIETRASAIDCAGAIAGAVGSPHFNAYAQEVASIAFEGMRSGHSRLRECAFCFFALLAKVFGPEFEPYVSHVVEALFKSLEQDELGDDADAVADASTGAVNVSDINVEGDIEDLDEEDEEAMSKLGFSSAIAIEKEIAAEALGEIFAQTKRAFLPYLEPSVEKLIAALDHFYDGVRKSAVTSLYRFIGTSYVLAAPAQWQPGFPAPLPLDGDVAKLAGVVRTSMNELLKVEDEKVVMMELYRNLAETIRLCGPAALGTAHDLELLCDSLVKVLQKEHACQEDDGEFGFGDDAAAGADDEDEDEIAGEEESSEYEALLVDAAADVVIALASALKASFEGPYGNFLPLLKKLASSSSSSERATAAATLGEVAAGLGEHVTRYTSEVYNLLIRLLADEDREVRSNSAYAIGLLCAETREDLSTKYMAILQRLQPLFHGDNHKFARDNAVGCTARMILAQPAAVPLGEVVPAVVANLPLTEDYAENAPVYTMLCSLLERSEPAAVQQLDKLAPVFRTVLLGPPEQLKQDVRERLLALVAQLQAQRPNETFAEILASR